MPVRASATISNSFQPIDFGHTSAPGKSGFESDMRLVNGYVEQLGKAKTPTPVYVTPGTTQFDKSSPLTGPCRGMVYVAGAGLYVLCGTSMAVFDANGQGTAVSGTVDGNGLVYMAANKAGSPQVGIVAGQDYYVLDTSLNTITIQNNPNLPPPNSVCGLDGYLVFSTADGKIIHTAINDALTIDALAFDTIGSAPYGLRRVIAYKGVVVALAERSLEIWQDVGTVPFAFSQNRTTFNIGCVGPQCAVVINENLLWVDHNCQVRQYTVYTPTVVSIPAVERAIRQLTTFQKSLLYATYTNFDGHDFYAITSLFWTWELDLTTGLWHERKSLNQNNWFARGWEDFNGARIVGSSVDAKLHLIDPSANTEIGQPFPFICQSETVTGFPKGLIFDELRVDAIPGVGQTNSGADNYAIDAQDPQLSLAWSDDGGQVWSPPRAAPLGKVGQRNTPVSYYQLGPCGRGGRIFQLSCLSTVMRGIFLVGARMRSYEV